VEINRPSKPHRKNQDDNSGAARNAREILSRADRDSADLFSTHLEKATAHFTASGEPSVDKVELWAKRTGRILGLILLVVLAVNLATGWFF
jgi:hypothetical protein